MYREPAQGDYFRYETDNSIDTFVCRVSQIQWVSFPLNRNDEKLPGQVEFINGKTWFICRDAALKLMDFITLKGLS